MVAMNRRTVMGGGAAAFLATPVFAHDPKNPGSWTPAADMPFPVQEIYPAPFWKSSAGTTSLKPTPYNIIVNAGGLTPSGANNVTGEVTWFDPQTNEWGYGPPLPQPRHHVALVNNNGFLFAIGGFARDSSAGWRMRNDVWRLKSMDATWEPMTPLPHPQAESVCTSLSGFLHVVGGRAPSGSRNENWSDHIDTDEHWVFDNATSQWREAAPMPTPRNSAAGAVLNGVLYVLGGRTVRDGNTAAMEVYDPLSDRWEQARPMPKAQGGLAAAALNGKIYAFGGEYFGIGGGGVFADAWEYDPREDKWRAIAAMARPRHGLGAVTLGNSIYVIGGAAKAGGAKTSAAVDKFTISIAASSQ